MKTKRSKPWQYRVNININGNDSDRPIGTNGREAVGYALERLAKEGQGVVAEVWRREGPADSWQDWRTFTADGLGGWLSEP